MGEGNRRESTNETLWPTRGSCGHRSFSCLTGCLVHHWCRDQRGRRTRADLRCLLPCRDSKAESAELHDEGSDYAKNRNHNLGPQRKCRDSAARSPKRFMLRETRSSSLWVVTSF